MIRKFRAGTLRSQLFFLLSFLLVGFAQPDLSSVACLLTALFGYALFWKALLTIERKSLRFCIATLWFAAITALHLSWFASDRYVGSAIFFILPPIILAIGAQFGLLSLMVTARMSLLKTLAISGVWVIFEWARLFFLTGYSWDPMGLSLSGSLLSEQMVSLFGVFGLSFWVMATNLNALRSFKAFSFFALFPYLFGAVVLWVDHAQPAGEPLNIALVQTALLPEEKRLMSSEIEPLSPFVQWQRIIEMVGKKENLDLIVLPESALPYGTDRQIYPLAWVRHLFVTLAGTDEGLSATAGENVSNSYIAQALANTLDADVVVGLESYEAQEEKVVAYNAAFHFSPHEQSRARYEKRVLVPMAEYIPFNWCKKILSRYGIEDSFSAGRSAKVFSGKKANYGVSICYEETFAHKMRENKRQGAQLLINVTNDVWYPHSRLPIAHFFTGRLRAMEMGIPLVRACNTGVTCACDHTGRVVGMLPYEKRGAPCRADVLCTSLPLCSRATLYSLFGDPLILVLSLVFITLYFSTRYSLQRR